MPFFCCAGAWAAHGACACAPAGVTILVQRSGGQDQASMPPPAICSLLAPLARMMPWPSKARISRDGLLIGSSVCVKGAHWRHVRCQSRDLGNTGFCASSALAHASVRLAAGERCASHLERQDEGVLGICAANRRQGMPAGVFLCGAGVKGDARAAQLLAACCFRTACMCSDAPQGTMLKQAAPPTLR